MLEVYGCLPFDSIREPLQIIKENNATIATKEEEIKKLHKVNEESIANIEQQKITIEKKEEENKEQQKTIEE